ncbi:tRNA (mnm(5)s(2)U34)-methyltransferase [Jeotgalibaca ciconiae]|uniref:Methyltransferase domain-containing protein n=1 Tax=Jeotgalibaca ciconiae TaxID=2496265 RepID=A0A3S9HDT6_9LACT|nr:class I SAM-dependent methyltransferase [Jeotgalibaca ciconiae]AZP05539.1 methyltransferase domain-containing protein [Jeotgalibaca ciconiae]HJB22613.1 methyltransferase domain-containing protein [Candidatus Jeotgalibaca pullicola]
MLKNAVSFSHDLLKQTIVPGDLVIDATVGNGNDTILLAQLTGSRGTVIGFDIQASAIEKTRQKLLLTGLGERVTLHQVGHENAESYLPKNKEIGAIIYNLGYLPGGDKSITTLKDSTIKSIVSLLPHLRIGSLLIIVIYSGHPAGTEEKDALLQFSEQLDQKEFSVLRYQFINQKNEPPFIIAIERRK